MSDYFKNAYDKTKNKTGEWISGHLRDVATCAGIGVAATIGSVYAAPVVLGAVGFTKAGVAAASVAASMQPAAVAAGSWFAAAQSVGATGAVGTTLPGVIGATATAISGGFLYVKNKWSGANNVALTRVEVQDSAAEKDAASEEQQSRCNNNKKET